MNKLLFQAVKYFDSKCPRGNYTDFANFIVWWIMMEEFMKDLSGKNDATRAINEIERNLALKSELQEAWDKIHIQTWSGKIQVICAGQPYIFGSNSYTISDPLNPNLIELLRVLYCIRGNLMHSDDDPMSDTKIRLYHACGDILAQWVKYLI